LSAYFITSTGTGIGKTFVTAGLIRHLRSTGQNVSALTPIVSGFEAATVATSDPAILLDALGDPITYETLARLSPWQFAASLSPDMAAAREGRCIDFEKLVKFCQDAIAKADGTLLIEGVGGIMVPLDASHTVLHWAHAIGIPVIVVAGSYLGTISHTLTALNAIAQSNLTVAMLIINETGDGDVPICETIASLRRFLPHTAIATIRRVGASNVADDDFATVAAMLD
jgi:dethiobiotin synthetase